jgi:hypothetical protein
MTIPNLVLNQKSNFSMQRYFEICESTSKISEFLRCSKMKITIQIVSIWTNFDQIFRKFQWFYWFFSKRMISRESWRAAEKSFKGRMRPVGRRLADAGVNSVTVKSIQLKNALKSVTPTNDFHIFCFFRLKRIFYHRTAKERIKRGDKNYF